MSGKFDVTISRAGYTPETLRDLSAEDTYVAVDNTVDGVLHAMTGGDKEAKISITIRPAKPITYEVWFSSGDDERHHTTFSQRNYAINHAKLLHANDGRHYYVKQRRGRKSVAVWIIGDPV